jgi:hypothetical protein
MAKLDINVGIDANDGTGDDLRAAFQKVNGNFSSIFPIVSTFTPVLIGVSSAGAGTYIAQVGRYTKVYNLVYYYIHLAWSAHTGTGNMRITGLPYTSLNTANVAYFAPVMSSSLDGSSVTYGGDIIARVNNNASTIDLLYQSGSGSNISMDTNGASITINGFFEITV